MPDLLVIGFVGSQTCGVVGVATREQVVAAHAEDMSCSVEEVESKIADGTYPVSVVSAPTGIFHAYQVWET